MLFLENMDLSQKAPALELLFPPEIFRVITLLRFLAISRLI